MGNKATVSICILLSFFILFTVNSCAKKKEQKAPYIAKVGDIVITPDQFDAMMDRMPSYMQEIAKKDKVKILQEIIKEDLLYIEAKRKGLEKDAEVKRLLNEAKKKVMVARLLEEEVDSRLSLTKDEVWAYYEANQDKFKIPERLRASHILVLTEDEATQLLKSLAEGGDFDELAKANSIDVTKERAGDIGYFSKGQLVPEFEKTCFALELGAISDIVKTRFGYHIIKLTEREDERIKPFNEVRVAIEKELSRIRRSQLMDQLFERLRKNIAVEINEELLASSTSGEEGVE